MKTRLVTILFVLIGGSVTSALAARIESTVTRAPANAETLLTVKAANFKPGWKVSADGSGPVAGPTVFKLGDNTGMVTLNVQAGPGPDGSFRLRQTFQVEVRKFQETVVVLQGISDAPVAASGKAAVAAVPTQGTGKTMGVLGNSCKTREVKYEFMFADKEYLSWTLPPARERSNIEVLSGTYKIRVFSRPFRTKLDEVREIRDATKQCKEATYAADHRGGVLVFDERAHRFEATCVERGTLAAREKQLGGSGPFRHRDSVEAFVATKDKWRFQFECKDGT